MGFEFLNNLTEQDIIIICIGTPHVELDSLGPLLGTLIKESTDIEVYGTMDNPIHALNVAKFLKTFQPKDKVVVALDACVGKCLGEVRVERRPVRPGAGVGKILPPVGDYAILITVATNVFDLYTHGHLDKINTYVDKVFNYIVSNLKGGETK